MAPDPHGKHGRTQLGVATLLLSAARRVGLQAMGTFNLGRPDDYRVPDAGLTADERRSGTTWPRS